MPDSQEALTTVEQQTLDAIKRYYQEHGYSPTVRELCELLHVVSTRSMQMRIERLIRKGRLTRQAGLSRTLRPVEVGE